MDIVDPPIYTHTQLTQMIAAAERLGFHDDVVHWQNELAKLNQRNGAL